jgi:hypothetical protein
MLSHAAEQCVSRPAKGAASPTGVLFAGIALLPLQNPLQRIVNDSPSPIELGYEAIKGVR